jgi:transposase
MNSSLYAIASRHGFKKTISQRRFRRRVGICCPLPGTPPRGRPSARARPARGPQRAEVDREDRVCLALHAPRPASVGDALPAERQRWLKAGVFEEMVHDLRVLLRLSEGRAPEPTAAILDSRTLRSTPESGSRGGYDGAKRKKGSKVHAAVDTLGNLLALHVSPANEQQRARQGRGRGTGRGHPRSDRRVGGAGLRRSRIHRGESRQRGGGPRHEVRARKARRSQAGLCVTAAPVGSGARFRMGIALSTLGEGLREATRHFVAGLHFVVFACLFLQQAIGILTTGSYHALGGTGLFRYRKW